MNARRVHGSEENAASALGRLLHDSTRTTPGSEDGAELERLVRTVRTLPPRAPSRAGWAKWALAAAFVLGVLGFGWHRYGNSALTFAADGVVHRDPASIAANAGRAVDLQFSDGSVFDVEPGAFLRVDGSSASGASMTLFDGRTVAHVVHRAKTSWSVRAGPFEVRVTGTRFGASWDAAHGRLSVELYEGSVDVVGGGLATPIAVRAGQRLEAGKSAGDWLLTSLAGPASPSPSAVPNQKEEPPASDSSESPAPSAPTVGRSSPRDWSALLERADFEGIVHEADEMGFEKCFSTCASKDLRMLADSARYLGRYELAERSLLALRKRSPAEAATAAFLLARLDEPRDPVHALSWYEKNLEEAPNGAYAAEALAGKMRALLKIGGSSAAAPVAEQYLERFPSGVGAVAARKVLAGLKGR